MKKIALLSIFKPFLILAVLLTSGFLSAQQQPAEPKPKSEFWKNVQFGGGLGLNFGSGFTDISLAPSAIYNFNQYVALGLGAQYSYVNQKNYYTSNLYGASVIGLFNPLRKIQLSAELEQLRVNTNFVGSENNPDDFWNTGLFLGAGFRTGNMTIGARYNVLHDNNNVYGDAFMPFVRAYF